MTVDEIRFVANTISILRQSEDNKNDSVCIIGKNISDKGYRTFLDYLTIDLNTGIVAIQINNNIRFISCSDVDQIVYTHNEVHND